MKYPYPSAFPQKSRDLVLAESIRAARDFERAKQEVRYLSETEGLLRNYILCVFIIFVREAGELGHRGLWTADQVESESREFLRLCTIRARYEKGYDRSGSRLRDMVSNWDGSILPEIQCVFEQSPQWKEYEDILLEVAEDQANRPKDESQVEAKISEPVLGGSAQTNWEDIEISLISDERVQLKVGTKLETRNYNEMGFEDQRNGKPNQGWGVLRALARGNGVISSAARSSKDFIGTEKRIERVRKTLRKHFRISSDPIPLDAVSGYCCRFKISCANSFEK